MSTAAAAKLNFIERMHLRGWTTMYTGTKINDKFVSLSVLVMKDIKSKAGNRRKMGRPNQANKG